jgi:hypothetical protein
MYVFGAFLLLTAAKMLLVRHKPDPKNTGLVRLARRLLPDTDELAGERSCRSASRAIWEWRPCPTASRCGELTTT